jgi:4-carboxymuconolactone decarboxylase
MSKTAEGPRIAPLQPPYAPQLEASLRKWMPPGSEIEPLALFRTLNVHEELASRMRPLGAGILGHGRVAPREREIVIHRTCARAGAEYEWGVHALAYGEPLGLTDEQLAATVDGDAHDPAWSASDALLIALSDELYDTATVSDELWRELAADHSDEQLLELLVIAGWYRLIAYVINAAGIEHEPWAARFPAAALGAAGHRTCSSTPAERARVRRRACG